MANIMAGDNTPMNLGRRYIRLPYWGTEGHKTLGNFYTSILNANGKHFSSGHDISPEVRSYDPWKSMFDDVSENGLMGMYKWETKHFLGYSRKWRDIQKPTIAAVQGACIAGGLMLVWPMDLIIAADNARFSDPVAVMAIGGVEYHGHTWELGARKAKEMLFTAEFVSAEEAHRIGFVHELVDADALDAKVGELAQALVSASPAAVRACKRLVQDVAERTIDDALIAATVEGIADIRASEEGREGVASFLQKRKPAWLAG